MTPRLRSREKCIAYDIFGNFNVSDAEQVNKHSNDLLVLCANRFGIRSCLLSFINDYQALLLS